MAFALSRFILTVVLAAAAQSALAAEIVVLFEDRHSPPLRSDLKELKNVAAEAVSAVWVWTPEAPPRRAAVSDLERTASRPAGEHLAVRIAREVDPRQRLTLFAAPAEMWQEVPENILPSWSVVPGATLRIPTDRGKVWRVRVVGAGIGSWWVDVPPGAPSVIVSPLQASNRKLRVVDGTGGDLGGVRISLLDEAPQRGDWKKLAEYRTDGRGRLVVTALPDAAPLLIVASTPDRAPRVIGARVSSLPDVLSLPTGPSVRGRLTDAEGRPVPGARVAVRTWVAPNLPLPLIRTADAKADGAFEVMALPAGRAEWLARAHGFAPASRGVSVEVESIDLGKIVMQPELKVPVEVRDDRGEAVARATLIVGSTAAGTTAANGSARISVAAGESFELSVQAERHRPAKVEITPPFPKMIRVTVKRSFRVTGRLTDVTGKPMPNGSVEAHRDDGSFSRHQIETDGRFALDLDAGVAHELEFRSTQSGVETLPVPEGQPGELRDVGDIIAPTGVVAFGRIVSGPDAAPVAGARVWLPRPSASGPVLAWAFRDVLQAVSDSDGAFELAGLPNTSCLLRIDAAGFASYRQAVSPDESSERVDLGEIRLDIGSNVVVRVDRELDEGAEVRADLGGRGMPMDMVRAPLVGGRATFANMPPGTLIVTVWRDRDLLCREEAEISEGKDSEIVCRAREVTLTGRIEVGGQPTGPGTVVWLTPVDSDVPSGIFSFGSGPSLQKHVFRTDSARYSSSVGFDGRFSANILPGAWDILWMPDAGQVLGPRRVVIPDAAAHQVVLSYPASVVRGVVVDAERRPVARAEVRELRGGGFALTRDDGSFVLAGPPPGRWEVQARHVGRSSSISSVLVEEGRETEPVELVLDAEANTFRVHLVSSGTPVAGAIVFIETNVGELRLATADANGSAEFRFYPPRPQRVRAAASAAGRWVLGTWVGAETAAKGVSLEFRATGALMLFSDGPSGAVTIATQDGWRVDRLLQWLGTFVQLAPSMPISLFGLPVGSYEIGVDGKRITEAVRRDETRTVRFE
ncbi:MAG: carboxypeptidase-like regulatory domain-containing protein [Thermoanaerobaculia bacterium]